ncbi:hypothetical protein EWE75_09480 [Sphingomonas populi]|uniref:DUF1444 family protein n=1 Tax=Sphingomonas populi TaxID=2484750 RepID=A0A4Q6XXC7_9SPHN|nr:hypothetical protein [Sphingomonas populi]RZF64621.1 hypothetical protein EWE75_09480 [Sphingomonas populi]
MALFSKLFGRSDDASSQPVVMSRRQFADHYIAMLAANAPDLTAERVDEDVRLSWPDGGSMRQFLGNAYAQYLSDPDAIDSVLEAQLASARATAGVQAGVDLDLVMPLIKSRAWLTTATAQAGGKVEFVIKPLVAHLIIVFAQDLPDTIAYVKTSDLDDDCDEDRLAARAIANLTARSSALGAVGGDGRYRIELDGFFDASLILIAAQWVERLGLGGDPVFAIPSRDQLLVCGSANAPAVAELADIAAQIVASDAYDISAQLLTLRHDQLQPL